MRHPPVSFNTFCALTLAACTTALATVGTKTETPMGWAGQVTTTGGTGGTEVTVTTMADLQKYAKTSGKYIIWVSGAMGSYGTRGNGNADKVTLTSDKSILGLPGSHINGSIILNGVSNVILRNLTVEGAGACDNDCGSAGESRLDAVTVLGSTNVWIDHCDIYDGEDGNTDITKNANYVTVSWVKFHYTDNSYPSGTTGKSHRYCNLIGSDDSYTSDAGKLKVTFYKTWWGEGVAERMPRVRFGQIHIANSLFTSTDAGQNYCVRAGYKADIVVEASSFVGQTKPIDLYDGDYTAVNVKSTNLFTNCSGNTAGANASTAFVPPYTLALSSASALATELESTSSGAGATLTWSTTEIAPTAKSAMEPSIVRQEGVDYLVNPLTSPLTASVWNASGRQIARDFVVAGGTSAALPAAAGLRIVRTTSKEGNFTRIIPSR